MSERGEDRVQGAELGPIGGGHSQAVALDQHHRGGVDSRPAIRPAHRAGMPARAGRGQALALAVAGQADALNDGVDSIAVALGVGPPLQYHDAHAFARKHPVGVRRERPGGPRPGQGVELAKDQGKIDVGLEVDAAGDGQVGPPLARVPAPRGRARPTRRHWRRRRRSWLRSDRADGRCARPWHWSTDRGSSPPRTEASWPEDRLGSLPGRPADHSGWRAVRIDSVWAIIRPC